MTSRNRKSSPLKATVVMFNKNRYPVEVDENEVQHPRHVLETIRSPSKQPKEESTNDFIERLIQQYGDQPTYSKPTLYEKNLSILFLKKSIRLTSFFIEYFEEKKSTC